MCSHGVGQITVKISLDRRVACKEIDGAGLLGFGLEFPGFPEQVWYLWSSNFHTIERDRRSPHQRRKDRAAALERLIQLRHLFGAGTLSRHGDAQGLDMGVEFIVRDAARVKIGFHRSADRC